MARERLAAIVIGLIMIGSVAGFAIGNVIPQNTQTVEIPHIINRSLTQGEIIYILQTGRVLIQNHYLENCTDCLDKNLALEMFAGKFKDFLVLETTLANETKLQMIGRGGEIRDLINKTINEENLMFDFCEIAMLQPKECLLLEI